MVQRVALLGAPGGVEAVELRFAGDYREPLDPATLESAGGARHPISRIA